MQKINYKEKILLEDQINELLIINIDDKLTQTKERDCIKITGEIKVSGEVSTNNGNKSFSHPIDVDIMLSEDQLISKEVNIEIDDFNYKIDDKSINIELIMKIDGLKEIEPYFPAQEDQEVIQVERCEEEENQPECEEIKEEVEECVESSSTQEETDDIEINEERNELDESSLENIEEDKAEETPIEKEKYSLLKQVFKNRSIKKETSFVYHVVKKESSYNEIASIYNIDAEKLKKINNDEEIYEGKLVLIPKA